MYGGLIVGCDKQRLCWIVSALPTSKLGHKRSNFCRHTQAPRKCWHVCRHRMQGRSDGACADAVEDGCQLSLYPDCRQCAQQLGLLSKTHLASRAAPDRVCNCSSELLLHSMYAGLRMPSQVSPTLPNAVCMSSTGTCYSSSTSTCRPFSSKLLKGAS